MNFLLSEIGIGNVIFESHICLKTVVRTYLYIKNRGLLFHGIACTLTLEWCSKKCWCGYDNESLRIKWNNDGYEK